MATFTKRPSLAKIILLTIFTLGLYSIYWAVVTKRELNRAGGNVPNAIFIFIPLINFYFWYRYAQSYTTIVKKTQDKMETIVYFLLGSIQAFSGFLSVSSWSKGWSALLGNNFSFNIPLDNHLLRAITGLIGAGSFFFAFFVIFAAVIAKIVIFQEGYNQYQE